MRLTRWLHRRPRCSSAAAGERHAPVRARWRTARRHVEIAQRARVVGVLGLDQGLVAPLAAFAFQQMAAIKVADSPGETQDAGLFGGDAHHRPQHVADQRGR